MKTALPHSFNGIIPRATLAHLDGETFMVYRDGAMRVGFLTHESDRDTCIVRDGFSVSKAVSSPAGTSVDDSENVGGLAVLNGLPHLFIQGGERIDLYEIKRPGALAHIWSVDSLPSGARLEDAYHNGRSVAFAGSSHAGIWVCGTSLSHDVVLVGEAGIAPTVAVDGEDRMHVCFHRDVPTDRTQSVVTDYTRQKINRTVGYVCVAPSDRRPHTVSHAVTVAEGISGFPSIAVADEQVLVVFQVDGSKRPEPGEDYVLTREGAGASLGFGWRTLGREIEEEGERTWRHGGLAISGEVVIRESGASPRSYSTGKLYPFYEWHGRPLLVLEADGTPVVLWCEETTGYFHWARWLGHEFEDTPRVRKVVSGRPRSVAAGLRHDSSPRPCMVLTDGDAQTVFVPHTVSVDSQRTAIDVADFYDFSHVEGVRRHLLSLTRSVHNPVFTPGPPGAWDSDMVTLPFVIFVPERNVYAMFYAGGAYHHAAGWRCGYAESADGISWRRRPIVIDGMEQSDNRTPYLYPFRDAAQSDPQRRYVSFHTRREGGAVDGIAYSPDCLHWTLETDSVDIINGTLHFTEIPVISYRNDHGDYFCIGRTFYYSGRSLGVQYSGDLVTWHGACSYPERPAAHGAPVNEAVTYGRLLLESSGNLPHEHQIYYGYGTQVRPDRYLLYYAPCRADGRYELTLAASRDGMDFDRVSPGEFLLPCGSPGEWDNGFIAGFRPVVVGDTLRFYYGSSGWHHNTDKHGAHPLHRPNWRIGMAEGTPGKHAYVSCDPHRRHGRLLTKEIRPAPGPVTLAAAFDGPPDAVSLRVVGSEGSSVASATGSEFPIRFSTAEPVFFEVELSDPAVRFFGLSFEHPDGDGARYH